MADKPNVLIVGNYNRRDYLDLFQSCRGYCNFYFLEYASRKEIISNYYQNYGRAIFWGDFKNASDLLQQIRPHKVIFFFIESYFHVILNLACKTHSIPTYLMDHGIRDPNINLRLEQQVISRSNATLFSKLATKLPQLKDRLRARLFLYRSEKELPADMAAFFKEFYKVRSRSGFITTFKKIKSPLRVADAYISFSPAMYEVHKHYDHLPANKRVYFIGVPNYDHLAKLKPATISRKQIIFLDQGLVARGFFGWTEANYKDFVLRFSDICLKSGYELLVKLHPVQSEKDRKLWSSLSHTKVINHQDLALQLPYTKIIIGFFSTYLLPLMNMPHTTVIALENHPAGKFDVSKSFTEAGVAHPVYTLEELDQALAHIPQLHRQQLPYKAKFTKGWLYKFDGKAGERLRAILLNPKL